jgi:arginyl-tRNA synthetase
MSLLSELSTLVGDAFANLGLDPKLGTVVVSDRPDLAQFQCNGAMVAAKAAKRAPRDIATDIAEIVSSNQRIDSVDVAGPGFLNLNVTDVCLADWLQTTAGDVHLGVQQARTPRSVLIDYGGPNVAKDLHVGHIRTGLIGESIKRLYRTAGHTAVGDVHLGDWGLPMGQLITALEDLHPELPYFSVAESTDGSEFPTASPVTVEDLQKLYPKASARSKEEPEFQQRARAATVALQDGHAGYQALWAHFRAVSVDAMKATYDRLGVEFELWLGEASVASRLEPLVEQLETQSVAVESNGALIIEVAEETDTVEVPPLMLRNSRGGATYATTDLATIAERIEDYHVDEIVYIVDLRQSLHFTQVFRAARLSGIAKPEVILTHSGNGTVNGPDGKPFKTRQGNLPRLSDLVDEVVILAMQRLDENNLASELPAAERAEIARLVGLGALKFGELSNHRTTNYSFDLDRFTQLQGRTGPYLQYVAVRTKSILGRAKAQGLEAGSFRPPTHDTERQLALAIMQWPETVERAMETHSPNTIAEYAYELSGVFNRFYDACHILTEGNADTQKGWLALVALTERLLVTALELLVIEIPDRM